MPSFNEDVFNEVRSLIHQGKSNREIMDQMEISRRTFFRYKQRIRETGTDPENDRFHKNPSEQIVSGYSTLTRLKSKDDESVGKVMEWVKTNVSFKEQKATAELILNSLIQNVKPVKKVKYNRPEKVLKDEFTVIPLGDPHVGLRVWDHQVGSSWDIETAQRIFKKTIERLLQSMPETEECVLVNTGDFFHADNAAGVTTRSGHVLDMDGTHGQWTDAGMAIIRMMMDACLRKYKRVTFVNVPGNHDDVLGRAMGGFVEQIYLFNDRVQVLKGDNPFQYIHRDKVLLGFCHGHTCKMTSLPGKMADDQSELWGLTTYRHWIAGHVHHKQWQQYKEHPGCTVETVGIIPPKDAYAHGGGYGARRTLQGLIFNSKHGEHPQRFEVQVRKDD